MEPSVVALVALVTAWNTCWNGFVWDDRAAVLSNTDVTAHGDGSFTATAAQLVELFRHDFWGTPIHSAGSHKSYRPLTVLSFRWNHAWHGLDPFGYHLVNVVVHAVCAVLVWATACVVLRSGVQGHSQCTNKKKKHKKKTTTSVNNLLNEQKANDWSQDRTVEIAGTGPVKDTRWPRMVAALLFAVHPIHCDAVASVVGRADLLCAMFLLAGFLAFASATNSADLNRQSWLVFISMVLAVMAGLCKELGFAAFVLYFVYDLLGGLSIRPTTDTDVMPETPAYRLVRHCPIALTLPDARVWRLIVITSCTATVAMMRVYINGEQQHGDWQLLANNIAVHDQKLARVLSYAHVHAWYLWKLVWPSWLCFDYGFDTIPVITSVWDSRNFLTSLAYAVVIAGVVYGIRTLPSSPSVPASSSTAPSPLLMAIAFGIIPFIPASNIFFPVGTVVAERLLYLPSVGFCLLVAYTLDHARQLCLRLRFQHLSPRTGPASPLKASPAERTTNKRAALVLNCLCGFILLAACTKSIARNQEWRSEEALFQAAVRVAPENIKVLTNSAKTVFNVDPELAIAYSRVAIGRLPVQIEGHTNFGLAYAVKGDSLLGIRHLLKASAFSPSESSALGYAGKHLFYLWMEELGHHTGSAAFMGRIRKSETVALARWLLDECIRRNTSRPSHFFARGMLSYHMGDPDTAYRYFETTKHANALAKARQVDLEQLVEEDVLLNLFAAVERTRGNVDEALEVLQMGIQQYPNHVNLYVNAAAIHFARLQRSTALELLDRALHVNAKALEFVDAAQFLERQREYASSSAFFQRAIELGTPEEVASWQQDRQRVNFFVR